MERRIFVQRGAGSIAVQLAGGCLVETDLAVEQANGFEEVRSGHAGDVRGGGRLFERSTNEALRAKVVDLVRLGDLDGFIYRVGVDEVDRDQVHPIQNIQSLQPPK